MPFLPALALCTTVALAADDPVSNDPVSNDPVANGPVANGHQASTTLRRGRLSAQLPRGVTSFGAATIGNQLFVLGGYFGTPHDYHVESQSDVFLRLDGASGALRLLPGIGPIQGTALVAAGTDLIQVGGTRILNRRDQAQDLRSTDECRAFDTLTSTWRDLPPLPEPRSSHDAVAVGRTVYVVGGWHLGEGGTEDWATTGLRLDLDAEQPAWSEFAQPFRSRGLALASNGDELLAIEGMSDLGDVDGRSWIFDLDGESWSEIEPFPGFSFGASAVGGATGFLASGRDGVLRRLDADSARWIDEGRLWFPRFFHRLVTERGTGDLLVVGGIGSGGRPTAIERLSQAQDGPPLLTLDVASPMAARSRQAVAVVRGDLILVGGNNGTEQHDFASERFEAESWRFDPSEGTWLRLADAPAPRQSSELVQLDRGTLALIGGFAPDAGPARSRAEVWTFRSSTDRWIDASPALPEPRTQFGIAQVADRLLIAGGMDYDAQRVEPFGLPLALLEADLSADSLEFVRRSESLPEPRRAHACASLGGELYLVGGMGPNFAPVDVCRAFDPQAGTWREVAAPVAARIGASLVRIGERLVLVGGNVAGGGGRATSIEVYDPARDRWTTLAAELPYRQGHVHAVAFGHELLVATTQEVEGRLLYALIDVDRVAAPVAQVEASSAIEGL
ncbi:Kelch repeat-containing protein [Engelhardtia mirabilis]|uniref:N-acetylneuraminate epimerase n=1 Tax=Engelhardtia mirabilis TaxID=2528011 RepID=A0A518BLM8_9BACT|nr:N-acetylneuraminate epimerase [Planctomycetes bacterium Pla133]QDV02189.1 N-acetylneuraminate epimerase [Planctomycetes bacterium Pla86]